MYPYHSVTKMYNPTMLTQCDRCENYSHVTLQLSVMMQKDDDLIDCLLHDKTFDCLLYVSSE